MSDLLTGRSHLEICRNYVNTHSEIEVMVSDSIGTRIKLARARAGIKSQQTLAELIGVSRVAVTQWESGKHLPANKQIEKIASVCGVSTDWILTGKEHRTMSAATLLQPIEAWDGETPVYDDEVELPLFREVELAAGSGRTHVQENHGARLRFAKSTLRRKGVPIENAACCFISGDSMEPILPDGSTVAVDTSDKTITDGKMYAIDHGGLLRVKYLYRLPGGGIRIRSSNRDEYPDEDLAHDDLQDLRIIGRVFWYAVLL